MLALQMIFIVSNWHIRLATFNYAASSLSGQTLTPSTSTQHQAGETISIQPTQFPLQSQIQLFSHGKGIKNRSGTNYISHQNHLHLTVSPTLLPLACGHMNMACISLMIRSNLDHAKFKVDWAQPGLVIGITTMLSFI